MFSIPLLNQMNNVWASHFYSIEPFKNFFVRFYFVWICITRLCFDDFHYWFLFCLECTLCTKRWKINVNNDIMWNWLLTEFNFELYYCFISTNDSIVSIHFEPESFVYDYVLFSIRNNSKCAKHTSNACTNSPRTISQMWNLI